MEKIRRLQEMITESSDIVFFGGAGVSTESGIPDFRSVDGLYHQNYTYPPETILSHSFFHGHTEEFYKFYKEKLLCFEAKPNFAHTYLVELEQQGKLRGIVTQNIDNLHFEAGSKEVFELHGNVQRNYCLSCGEFFTGQEVFVALDKQNVPLCPCGGLIKPDVVLYEEGLPQKVVESAVTALQEADMLIIAGTSLAVYPAASFIDYFHGKYVVVINQSDLSVSCDLSISAAVGETFLAVKQLES